MIVSFLIHEGTQDILSKRVVAARTCAAIANFFEQWVAMSLRKVQFGWQWGRVYELYKADQHTLVSYFRNRINCKCLDDKHKEVRSIKKIGICCNPLCPLPERKLERSATMSCDHCKLVTYCSLAHVRRTTGRGISSLVLIVLPRKGCSIMNKCCMHIRYVRLRLI